MSMLFLTGASQALVLPPAARWSAPSTHVARCAAPTCCICVNCKLVERCATYSWVELQHEQEHISDVGLGCGKTPDFAPADPQIQVFIQQGALYTDALLNRHDPY